MTDTAVENVDSTLDTTVEASNKTSSELSSMKKEILRNYIQDQVVLEFENQTMPTALEDIAELGGEDLSSLITEWLMEDFEKKIEAETNGGGGDFLDKVRANTVGGIQEHVQGAIREKVSSMLQTSLGAENFVAMMAELKEKTQVKYLELRTATEGEIVGLHDEINPPTPTTTETVATETGVVAGAAVAGSHEVNQSNSENLSETEAAVFFEQLGGEKPSWESFYPAYEGRKKLVENGEVENQRYLGIMDFSQASSSNRFVVMDMETKDVSFNVPAGHGSGSGTGSYAEEFSNVSGSNESSLGFVKTGAGLRWNSKKTWKGLWLYGMEDGINDQSDERGIALHPGSVQGSKGCITLPENATDILQKMKGGAMIFGYHSQDQYYTSSDILDQSHDLV